MICQRNCQDCSLPQLQEWLSKGFTSGTQCVMAFDEMLRGGRWEVKMRHIRDGVTINTKDYQGMPSSHAEVSEFDRDITGSEWQAVGVDDAGNEVEIGRLLFEGSGKMGIV